MAEIRHFSDLLKVHQGGHRKVYPSLWLIALLLCGYLTIWTGLTLAQDEQFKPAIALDPTLEAEVAERAAEAAWTLMESSKGLPEKIPTFESVEPMGALASASVQPAFEDINPDNSTLDASNPNGASAGRCNGLSSVAGDNQTFYLASEWGGLYKSDDGGLTWEFLDGHMPLATWDVEVDPVNTNTVYATSFYDGRLNSISGIQVSTDAGNTWAHPATAVPDDGTGADNTPQPGYACSAIRRTEPSAFGIGIRPDAPANVIVGTNCGVAVSDDSGVTWQFIDPTVGTSNCTDGSDACNVWDVVWQPASTGNPDGIIDICGDDGHLRSTDGGLNWTASAGALPTGRCSIAVSPDEDYVLFVAASDNNLYESDDAGTNWSNLGNPQPQGRIPFVTTNQRTDDGDDDRFDVWFGDVQLFRADCTSQTAQGGTNRCLASGSWTNTQTEAHWDSGDVVFDTQAANDACPMQYTNDGGVYYNTVTTSPDCHDPIWEQPNKTPHALWLFAMDGVDQPGDEVEDLYFGCQDTGSFAALDAGAAKPTWDNHECCDSFDFVADANRVIWTVCCGFSLVRSGRGLTGDTTINGPPGPGRPAFRYPDYIDQFGDNLYVAVTGSGAYTTDDITASPVVWTQLGAASTPAGGFCAVKASVVSDGTPTFYAQTFCPGGNNGIFEIPGSGQLWKYEGSDTDNTWERIDNNDGLTPNGIAIFAVDPTNPDRLYASYFSPTGPQMIFSNDGGQTWDNDEELDNLMRGGGVFKYRTQRGITPGPQFNGYAQPSLVAFDPEDPDIIVAGGRNSGVFISRNSGARWSLLTDPFDSANSGIPHLPRPWFAYFDHEPADSGEVKIYIGTVGRGVWRISVATDVPVISVPGSVVFTDTCVGETSTATLNVCNTGGGEENLEVDPITSTDPQFSVTEPTSGFPVEISPDFCFPFEVTFTPTSEGPHSTILSIASNDPVDPIIEVQASGDGTNPQINTLIADNGNFGDVCVGDIKDLDLTISNSGGCDLSVSDITSSSAEFKVPAGLTFPLVIAAGDSLPVPIRFAPESVGPKAATITVDSNDPTTPEKIVDVSGIAPPPVATPSGELDFGQLCIGESKSATVKVCNTGACNLSVTRAELTGPDCDDLTLVSPDPAPTVADPLTISKDFCFDFIVKFTPDDLIAPECTLEIDTDDPNYSTIEFAISAAVGEPQIVLDPADLTGPFAFPATVADPNGNLGCFSDQMLVIRNNGTCPLEITDISADSAFQVTAPTEFNVVLPPGEETLEVNVRFAPAGGGGSIEAPDETTGTLTVVSNDPGGDATADLCGEATVQSGIRVLVIDGAGNAVDEVDQLALTSKGINTPSPIKIKLKNVTLLSDTVCGNAIQYHLSREDLPPTETTGSNPKSSYQISAKEKNKQASMSFKLGQCEFKQFVLQLK